MQVFKTFSLSFFLVFRNSLVHFSFQYHYYYFIKFLCASLTLMVKKSTVVSALINAQLTGRNSFSYQMVLEGNAPHPPPPPDPQGATLLQLSQQTAVKTVAFLAVSGLLRDVLDSQPLSIAVSVTLLKVPYWTKIRLISVWSPNEVPRNLKTQLWLIP